MTDDTSPVSQINATERLKRLRANARNYNFRSTALDLKYLLGPWIPYSRARYMQEDCILVERFWCKLLDGVYSPESQILPRGTHLCAILFGADADSTPKLTGLNTMAESYCDSIVKLCDQLLADPQPVEQPPSKPNFLRVVR